MASENEKSTKITNEEVAMEEAPAVSSDISQNNSNNAEVETDTANRDSPTSDNGASPVPDTREKVQFKVVYNKQKHDVSFPLDDTVSGFKQHLEKVTGVPVAMQKVMFKGRMKDECTLREHKVTKGAKIMLVGSTVSDVMSVSAPDPKVLKEEEKAASASKEPLSTQKPHKTVLEKYGKPEDLMVGVKRHKEALPPVPISGMYNSKGGKVRLTFKLEQDQLWIGTKERTDKFPMNSIKAVHSEPIKGHEEYQMMGFQVGTTEASCIWVYWVPSQYVDAIKDAVLGKWQFF